VITRIEFVYVGAGELPDIIYAQGNDRLKLITVKEAAKKLCYSERYVQQLIDGGVLIAIKPHRDYYVFDFSVQMFAKARDK